MYCGQTAGWIKMPLGMEVGLDPGHIVALIVLNGDLPPIFGSCLFCINGWMDQDATW